MWETIKSGEEWRGEFRNKKKNGELYWESASISPVFDSSGKITHFVAVKEDITERKHGESETRRRVAELEVLYENGIAINSLLDPREVAQKTIDILARKLNWHHAAIRVYDWQKQRMEILAFLRQGMAEDLQAEYLEKMEAAVQKPGQGFSGWVIQHGESVRCDDVEKDDRYVSSYPGIRSGLYVPMRTSQQIVGVIAIESNNLAEFNQEDQRLLETVAAQTAVAVEKAQLYQATIRASERSAVVARAGQEIATAGLDLEKVYQSVHRATAELFPLDAFSIVLADEEHKSLKIVYLFDEGNRYPLMSAEWGAGISGYVIRERKPLLIKDYLADHPAEIILLGSPKPARSMLYAPLYSGEKIVGVFSAQHYQPNVYTEEDVSLLSVLANFAGTAIENAHLYDELTRRLKELGALMNVSSELRTATTTTEIYSVILTMIMDILKADGAGLAVYEPAIEEATVVAGRGAFLQFLGMRIPKDQGGTGRVVSTGKPYISSNSQEEEPVYRLAQDSAIRSIVFLPLIAQGNIIGVLSVGRGEPIAESDLGLLSAIADIAANAIRRSNLHEQTVRYADQLKTVNEIGRMLSETLEPDQIYVRLTGAIYNLLPNISGMFLSLYDQNSKIIICTSAYVDEAFIDAKSLPPLPLDSSGKGCQSKVLITGEPIIASHLTGTLGKNSSTTFIGDLSHMPDSALYVPMFSKGTPIGLIQVQSYMVDRFHQEDVDLLSLVANTAAVAIENARLFAETQSRLRFVSALHAIDTVISASVEVRVTMSVILEKVISELGVDAAAVALMNPHTRVLEFIASRGFLSHTIEGMQVRMGESLPGQAVIERRIIKISRPPEGDASEEKRKWVELDPFGDEKFLAEYAIPLIAKGQVQGILQICNRSEINETQEWSYFFDTLAGEAAIAIENARLFDDLQRSNIELSLAYDSTIEGWSRALDLRDKETEGHTQRVTSLTVHLARAMGIRESELVHIRRGALLHDIGKMGVPDHILFKPDKLTEEEWVIMRRHPRLAYDMLSPIAYLRPALDIPYCHHEKWDGSGYPRGLKGEEIPIAARLFAIVDVWDALTSDRPYGKRWPKKKVREYICSLSGVQFEPAIVDLFFRIIDEDANE
jgi:HD-GYP domain-containing protein (c-di-GMP phosphodiesterase class II)/putative methionine-R-sulfoxide reductase with GAF domain